MVVRKVNGFTVIELIIVIVILGILASLAISAYQTYTVRAQVSEGLDFASPAQTSVAEAYLNNRTLPANRAEAGISPEPAYSAGRSDTRVDVVNGRIDITFGSGAHPDIAGETLSLTPFLANNETIVWRCGDGPLPAGTAELYGSGDSTKHRAPTVDPRYLPSSCR